MTPAACVPRWVLLSGSRSHLCCLWKQVWAWRHHCPMHKCGGWGLGWVGVLDCIALRDRERAWLRLRMCKACCMPVGPLCWQACCRSMEWGQPLAELTLQCGGGLHQDGGHTAWGCTSSVKAMHQAGQMLQGARACRHLIWEPAWLAHCTRSEELKTYITYTLITCWAQLHLGIRLMLRTQAELESHKHKLMLCIRIKTEAMYPGCAWEGYAELGLWKWRSQEFRSCEIGRRIGEGDYKSVVAPCT